MLDGLEGKWDALALNMINWSFNDVIDELISRAEREQVVTPMAYRTEAQRPPFQRHYQARRPPLFPCTWCKSMSHHHYHCDSRMCSNCGKSGHYGRECPTNKPYFGKYIKARKWMIDSGATVHITNSIDDLENWRSCQDEKIVGIKGESAPVIAKGDVPLTQGLTLKNVHCVPEANARIISVGQLEKEGFEINIRDGVCKLKNGTEEYEARKDPDSRIYTITEPQPERIMMSVGQPVKASSRSEEDWHNPLCHMNRDGIKNLIEKHLVEGMKLSKGHENGSCSDCVGGKMTKADQDKVAYRLASHPGEIISCDVLDLGNLPGMNEERYVSVIIDHFTGYTSTKSLCRKQATDVLKHIQEFVSFIEQQSERNVKIVRSDNGLEYNNEESSAYFKERHF